MMIALEGIAGSGKSALRDRILALAADRGVQMAHVGQFSWLSLPATRVLVALRTGRAPVGEAEGVAAVLDDLALHTHHNLSAAAEVGHVLADRLALSSACLLGLTYPGALDRHVEALAGIGAARPDLTVLLTTPVEVCAARLAGRPAARRVGDDPPTATRSQGLYLQCADAWQRSTGTPVLRRALNTPADTDTLASELLEQLQGAHHR